MINLSVDAADQESNTFNPTINEIESIVELVLEVIMEKGDVLPEQDEPDPETEIYLTVLDHMIPTSGIFNLESKHYFTRGNFLVFMPMNYKNPVLSNLLPPPRIFS